jgi:SecD/SecF fusion protein
MLGFDRFKVTLVTAVCLLGIVFALPNLFQRADLDKLPSFFPKAQINLGLDLKGGSYLLLETDFQSVFKEQLVALQEAVRPELKKANIAYKIFEIKDNKIHLVLENSDDAPRVTPLMTKLDSSLEILAGADGVIHVGLSPHGMALRQRKILDQSIEIVRRRLDESGTKEPGIQSQGEHYIQVQLPGVDNPAHIKALLGKTAKMTFHLVDDKTSFEQASKGNIPPGSMIVPYERGGEEVVHKRVMLGGDRLVDAHPDLHSDKNEWVLAFKFDALGAKKFGDITKNNVGKRFAILLDGKVLSAPRINGPILGGSGIIEGSFTAQSAQDLALLMRAGALPAPLKVIEERTVGPDLGSDSIHAGAKACIIALIAVVIFMMAYYGKFGFIANIGLIFNLIIMIAVLSVLGATLTLPGIAGIVLTMGMAVDANVLINARIDEELRSGKTALASIEAGYNRALTSIVDANITTILAAGFLYYFGSGPVRGFAVTLTVGLLTSMFTAITISRLIIAGWWLQFKPKTLKVHLMRFIPEGTRYDFMSKTKLSVALSIFLVIASIGFIATKGLNMGVDFKGGIVMEAKSAKPIEISDLREKLNALKLGEVTLQEFGSKNDVLVRFDRHVGDEKAQMKSVETIKQTMGEGYEYRRVEFVGPKVGDELIHKATLAIIFSLLAIMVYVWIRFEWQFGVSGVAALIIGLISTFGFISALQLEFNLPMVASILTILGYCINDTVIIFDRIRENLRKDSEMPLTDLLNLSINETLARTIITVLTVLIVLTILYLFGGPILAGFSLAMIWGVVIGTISSHFIAISPLLWLNLKRRFDIEEDGFQPKS